MRNAPPMFRLEYQLLGTQISPLQVQLHSKWYGDLLTLFKSVIGWISRGTALVVQVLRREGVWVELLRDEVGYGSFLRGFTQKTTVIFLGYSLPNGSSVHNVLHYFDIQISAVINLAKRWGSNQHYLKIRVEVKAGTYWLLKIDRT